MRTDNELERVVFLAVDVPLSAIVYNSLNATCKISHVIFENPRSIREIFRSKLQRFGFWNTCGQFLFRALIIPWVNYRSQHRIAELVSKSSINLSPIPRDRITYVNSVNDPGTIKLLQSLAPRVVVINGTRILSKELLQSVPSRFVNIHLGLTPRYRGVYGAYWALVENNQQDCGVTLHQVDEGIDTGCVYWQGRVTPSASDSVTSYGLLQIIPALQELTRIVSMLIKGEEPSVLNVTGQSRLWTHPTFWGYLLNRWRFGIK